MTLILIIFFLMALAFELVPIKVYGFYVDKKALDYFNKYKNTYWVNSLSKNMLVSYEAKYISKLPKYLIFPLFCEYYIENIGMVVKWSKAHKEIEQLFKELKEKQ